MAFGFKAFNNGNEVLIDSSTKNLFFLGKARYIGISSSTDYCGGSRVLKYQTNTPKIPLPFFSYPYTSNTYVALIKIVNISGNVWEVYLLVSGTNITIIPEVYIFIEYDKILSPYGKYGMVIYQDNSTSEITFDSRCNPLAIKAEKDVTPTSSPYSSSDSAVLSSLGSATYNQGSISLTNGALTPNNSISYAIPNISITKPIFNYSSSAQAYKQYNMFTDESYWAGWFDTDRVYKYFYNNYATFSRPGIKYSVSGTNIIVTVGWIIVSAGQYNPGVYEKRERLIGFDSTSRSMAGYTGTWKPSTSLNIRATGVTVADGSRYD